MKPMEHRADWERLYPDGELFDLMVYDPACQTNRIPVTVNSRRFVLNAGNTINERVPGWAVRHVMTAAEQHQVIPGNDGAVADASTGTIAGTMTVPRFIVQVIRCHGVLSGHSANLQEQGFHPLGAGMVLNAPGQSISKEQAIVDASGGAAARKIGDPVRNPGDSVVGTHSRAELEAMNFNVLRGMAKAAGMSESNPTKADLIDFLAGTGATMSGEPMPE